MKSYFIFLLSIVSLTAYGSINTSISNAPASGNQPLKGRAGDCVRGKATALLEVNNIRAMLLNSGDLWWDRTNAQYQAPKLSKQQVEKRERAISPLFAGSVWVSGRVGGNLRMAAIRYSQGGSNAWWPGVLKEGEPSIDKTRCEKFDRFWSVLSEDIVKALSGEGVSQSILEWPGKGNPYLISKGLFTAEELSESLAPFYDLDGNCRYDPEQGEVPCIKTVSPVCPEGCNKFTYADQMIFWVINDVGNAHAGPSSTPIGAQMNCLAFAFKSSDELNDMTFYTYEIHNKSNVTLEETYMSQYMDADLGNFNDDYVGCDTGRSLGFIYNADDIDENSSTLGYLDQPAIFGADFFEGPKKANGTPIGLSSFLYYINATGQPLVDPNTEIEHRNFQEGFTRTGGLLTVSNDCIAAGFATTKFCFSGDPSKPGEWSMCDRNFTPRDLRWLQNSGPFDMQSGSHETITIGCIFVRPPKASQTGCRPAMRYLQDADDKAQRLFEFCFEKAPGPDAPDIKIIEAPNAMYFSLENKASSNNFGENYNLKNIDVPLSSWNKDTTYKFEGYAIYQILSENAISTLDDLKDPTKAKLVKIMDRKNSIERAVNFKEDVVNGKTVTIINQDFKLPNAGIEREFKVDKDLFQFEGQSLLINNKTYYYATLAFAYNNYKNPNLATDYQRNQLIFSNSIKIFKGTPHNNDFWGLKTKKNYYDGLPVTRVKGQGHGKYFLDLENSADEEAILTSGSKEEITYQGGKSPLNVKVLDPFKLRNAKFTLTITDSSTVYNPNKYKLDSTSWKLDIEEGPDTRTIYSEGKLDRDFSQSISAVINSKLESYGIAVAHTFADTIGSIPRNGNKYYGYVGGEIIYKDSTKKWLRLLSDENATDYTDWIRSGTVNDNKGKFTAAYNIINGNRVYTDPNENFAKILGGTFAPYCLTANAAITAIAAENNYQSFSPGFKWRRVTTDSLTNQTWGEAPENNLDSIYSLDLVITSDKSKWSKSLVFETGESQIFNEGNAFKGQLRQGSSLDKDGNVSAGEGKGLSWFPGYAINLETGVRMNVYFGENSRFRGKNAANMLWDPDSTTKTVLGNPLYGGSQFIYVMNSAYDENKVTADRDLLAANFNQFTGAGTNQALNTTVANFYRQIAWSCVPLMNQKFSFYSQIGEYQIPSDLKIKIRVEKPYSKLNGSDESIYKFSTEGMQPDKKDSLISSAFDKTMVVPNPYYAFSSYELNATQNVVKIINVPKNSTVSIFTTDGMLVRRLKLDPSGIVDGYYGDNSGNINYDNAIDWDLRTTTGVLIASGVYYINIEAPNLGTKVLKLFATMRAADVSNF
jgi:hypothetical protein